MAGVDDGSKGAYLVEKQPSDRQEAEKAWNEYVTYVRRYNAECGLNFSSETCRRM